MRKLNGFYVVIWLIHQLPSWIRRFGREISGFVTCTHVTTFLASMMHPPPFPMLPWGTLTYLDVSTPKHKSVVTETAIESPKRIIF